MANFARAMVEPIARGVGRVCEVIRTRYVCEAHKLRGSAENVVAADHLTPHPAATTDPRLAQSPESARLHGIDRAGNLCAFEAKDVLSVTLRNYRKRLIGLSFPTIPDEIFRVKEWGRQPRNTISSQVEINFHETGPDGERLSKPYLRMPVPARWKRAVEEFGGPLIVGAHCEGDFFKVPVSLAGVRRNLLVTGSAYAHILAENQHFRILSAANPHAPLLLMSCMAGASGAVAGPMVAHTMRAIGAHAGDIYGATDVFILRWGNGEAKIGVEVTAESDAAREPFQLLSPGVQP